MQLRKIHLTIALLLMASCSLSRRRHNLSIVRPRGFKHDGPARRTQEVKRARALRPAADERADQQFRSRRESKSRLRRSVGPVAQSVGSGSRSTTEVLPCSEG